MAKVFGNGIEKYVSKAMKLRILAGKTPDWMTKHIRGRYIIMSTLSAPLWVHRRDFREKRAEAIAKSAATGIDYVLDHDIPIDHPYVCGLTVPWNIVVRPHVVNAHKRNEWHPDQTAFDFDPPRPADYEQLRLAFELHLWHDSVR